MNGLIFTGQKTLLYSFLISLNDIAVLYRHLTASEDTVFLFFSICNLFFLAFLSFSVYIFFFCFVFSLSCKKCDAKNHLYNTGDSRARSYYKKEGSLRENWRRHPRWISLSRLEINSRNYCTFPPFNYSCFFHFVIYCFLLVLRDKWWCTSKKKKMKTLGSLHERCANLFIFLLIKHFVV